MKKRRVVITGAGLITPAGLTLEENWDKIVTGRTAISRIDDIDTSFFPVKLCGKVKGFDAMLIDTVAESLPPCPSLIV